MSEPWIRNPILRTALYAIGSAAIAALLAQWIHHRNRPGASAEDAPLAAGAAPLAAGAPPLTAGARPSTPPQAAAPSQLSTSQILAGCHPHLSLTSTSVPNIDVSNGRNPAAVRLKVRFWVNGDGFVTNVLVTGANVVARLDQEAELDYVQHLTFVVPNTEECRVRQMEMIGNFLESRDSGGEWATVFEVHPRYSLDGNQVVQYR